MAGKSTPKARSRVTRAKPATETRNPGPSPASLAADTRTKPGQVAFGPTGATAGPAKRGSQVAGPAGRGVSDRSSAATGTSIFEKADAGNRRLGRRNRS